MGKDKRLSKQRATRSELLFGVVTPTALVGRGNILEAQ